MGGAQRATLIDDARPAPSRVVAEEAGTAPGDRRFRPDVEGLRAIAIALVVLYHAHVPHVTGGFVGVDVFFVISGFVITGLLLRERQQGNHTSVIGFYARRARRILPAATLVIVVTVLASYYFLGSASGNVVADDGRWAAVLLANFHFAALGTNYLTELRAPSPLQNFWSLSVEEQFYLVYPTLFLVIAVLARRLSHRLTLAAVLGVVIFASFAWSVAQTASDPTAAYFSPLTRAWELALGALIAVATPWLKRLPSHMAAVLSWAGMAAIMVAAVTFTASTPYPGSLVAVPVLGAGLVIAAGLIVPRAGAESLLGTRPFQWLGRRSYSLYLWHWPLLVIAAEHAKRALPLWQNLIWVAIALLLAIPTASFIENPIRRLRTDAKRTVVAGVVVILLTVAVLSEVIVTESGPNSAYRVVPVDSELTLLRQVAAAPAITSVPADVLPPLTQSGNFFGGNYESPACQANGAQWTEKICVAGDPHAKRLMVLYGDSHALMWLPAFQAIAVAEHWRLVTLAKFACPAEMVTIASQHGVGQQSQTGPVCDQWHRWALGWINAHHPNLLVVSQFNAYLAPGTTAQHPLYFSAAQWGAGLAALHRALTVPHLRQVFLGGVPAQTQGPTCLSEHPDDAPACVVSLRSAVSPLDAVEQSVSRVSGMTYINAVPWFCTDVCTVVIDRYSPFDDPIHINGIWALYLERVLAEALGIPDNSPRCFLMTPTTVTAATSGACAR